MKLLDLTRTTSFRLAITFLLLFAAACVGLFTFVHWETKDFLTEKTDDWITLEMSGLKRLSPEQLADRLTRLQGEPGVLERPFALFDPSAKLIVGAPIAITPEALTLEKPGEFTAIAKGRPKQFRGIVWKTGQGNYLLVAQGLSEQAEFDERLLRATSLAAAATAVLGLIGAIFLGVGAMRQIDNITRATERIVKGDLSQRLPLGRAGGDIDRLTRVVNQMLEEIERLISEVKGVCDNIAHDMRTPLTRLLAGLERGRRRATGVADYQDCVDEAVEEVHGILKTFGALLRISEVEDGIRRSGFVEVDLSVIVNDAIELFEPAAEERDITLTYNAPASGEAVITGDPDLLFEAISNLIDNALKFTPPGGNATVTVKRDGATISVIVDDTGPGIPEDEMEAVLRRFHRAERSRTAPGNGLGLSLVAAIARLHDFRLSLANTASGCRVSMEYDVTASKRSPR